MSALTGPLELFDEWDESTWAICPQCRVSFHRDFFPANKREPKSGHRTFARLCRVCREENGIKARDEGLFRTKLRNCIGRHFRARGFAPPYEAHAARFGWPSIDQLTELAEHAYQGICPDCIRPYSEMHHGMAELTLDVIKPSEPLYYTNVRWVCQVCNRRKHQMGERAYSLYLAMRRRREAALKARGEAL